MRKAFILLPILAMALFASCNKSINRVPTDTGASKTPVKGTHSTGTTYYVDPAGNDSNDGQSTATAWQSISKVNAQTFLPGDQILFKAGGSWSGNIVFLGSGTSDAPIVVDLYGTGNKPIINGGGLVNGSITLLLNNQSFWEINNLEITNTITSGLHYAVTGIKANNSGTAAASHIYVKNCYVHDVNSTGVGNSNYNKGTGGIIFTGLINDVLVQNCHVANCQIEGIRTSSSTQASNVVFDGNLIENVYGDGIVLNGVTGNSKIINNTIRNTCMSNLANYAGAWTYNSYQTLIAHNEISGIVGGNIDGQPFDADINTNGDIFEYNYSHDNKRGFMLFMPSATNIIVRYNLSVNDVDPAGTSAKMINYTSNNSTNKIYNNTFFFTGSIPLFFEYTNTSSPFAFNATFNNNIVAGGTVTQFSAQPITASTATFQNNCFYPSSITSSNGPAGVVSNNIYANPQFVNATSGASTNFNLLATSPCLNTGLVMTGNGGIDFYGTALPAGAPDIGFYQHISTGTTSTLNATADSYIRDGSYATTNYGTLAYTVVKSDAVGYARKAYEKFDFSSVPATSVQVATLSLYVNGVNTAPTRTISVYTTQTENWGETSINWNNAPTDTTYVGQIVVTGVGTYALDVKNAINTQLAKSDHIVSFLLQNNGANSSTNDITLNSREATSNQPTLTVTY
ncbi:Right handed beta helix region [Mucilaginibacter lappiensis]|uniref:Right handed beta helix region n=1 Tax=Mucilaginibacter lappiensis TaxID=354630 RepID=A0ABR6PUY7_9SPHI|nr:DNRLRE domain-containing protein [Mucilaginibacter lappiensis]MBB6112126.1 hypothetical protein [Mucilaginibacter lappiensis]SIR94121.1 Right handed beta helix region [Mucilaginibacter lappiensis]